MKIQSFVPKNQYDQDGLKMVSISYLRILIGSSKIIVSLKGCSCGGQLKNEYPRLFNLRSFHLCDPITQAKLNLSKSRLHLN